MAVLVGVVLQVPAKNAYVLLATIRPPTTKPKYDYRLPVAFLGHTSLVRPTTATPPHIQIGPGCNMRDMP